MIIKYKTLICVMFLLISNLLVVGYYHKTVGKYEMQIFAMEAHERVLLYTTAEGVLKNDFKGLLVKMLSYDFDPFYSALGKSACDIAKEQNKHDMVDLINKFKNSEKYPKRCE